VRIAQISPLYESVPPKLYGGTERVVHFLTEALVDLGHDVTLFASGDSRTSAELVAPVPQALRLIHCLDPIAPHYAMMEEVVARAGDFDVLHFHTDYLGYSLARRQTVPYATTMHGRLDTPELEPIFETFAEAPLISISDAQREPHPRANWQGTVYHGLPLDLYHLVPKAGGYLAFVASQSGKYLIVVDGKETLPYSLVRGLHFEAADRIGAIGSRLDESFRKVLLRVEIQIVEE